MEMRDLDIICNSSVNWQMYRNKKVLITGVTGRIGRYIFETLVDIDLKYNLNMKLYGLARSEEKARDIFGNTLLLPNVNLLYQDVNSRISLEENIDYIFHTAGPAAPKDFRDKSVETLWAHVNGTHNVCEFAKEHNTDRIFYVSTVEIYGEWNSDVNIKEDDMGVMQHLNYRACYPEAKRLCETMLATYKEEYGLDYCGVRLCHTLGPGIILDDGRAFADFLNCALNGSDIVLHSDGSAMRTYTYTADAINAIFLIMDKGQSTFYNVASDENLISIRDLALLISKLPMKNKVNVLFDNEVSAMPYLPFKLAIMDTNRVRDLGWRPQVSINNTFKWTYDSLK